jgi:hypothetical protein
VSYKNVLIGRYGAAQDAQEESVPLSYIDIRNREALQAWRERCIGAPAELRSEPRRSWLASLIWVDSASSLR